jgi:hypothetical protein
MNLRQISGWAVLGVLGGSALLAPSRAAAQSMRFVRVSDDRQGFVLDDGSPFLAWGFNYDHDEKGRLLEDCWQTEWPKVQEDFQEMKDLGANVVRLHLQLGKFMKQPDEPNEAALTRLGQVVELAQRVRLHLDLTGLACYHKKDVPAWYEGLSERDRWAVQARFWKAVAGRCSGSPAIFCYDLMNEPILPGNKKETEWLAGELDGKFFVQRLTLDLAGRTQQQVAEAWVDQLVAAIRKQDRRHLITVGVIPWALVFPKAKPLFYSKEVSENLDFASVHFYPEKGKIDQALAALAVYDIGKPLVVEEMFPLKCSAEELGAFIDGSRKIAEGWIGFYWGKTPEEYRRSNTIGDAMTLSWLELFRKKAAAMAP